MVEKMKRIFVSVLVPVYNVEDYLSECLDSLVGQTMKNIEIICINDGSTDGSLRILKEYAKKDNRLRIINKKNTGYGDSMNIGLKEAVGEYVGIVEPDDFVDLNTFEEMYKIANERSLDVVKCNFYEYSTVKKHDIGKSNMFLPEEIGKVIDPKDHRNVFYMQPSIWSAIYRRDFLRDNDIWFLPSPGASYQDAGFSFKVWASAKRVFLMNKVFLHYRQDNPNSSVKSSGKINAVKEEYDEVERFLRKKGLMDEYGATLATVRFGGYIWNMRRLTSKAAREFGAIARKDYERIKSEGYLNAKKMDNVGRNNAKSFVIKHPNFYVTFRPLHECRNKLRGLISDVKERMRHAHED